MFTRVGKGYRTRSGDPFGLHGEMESRPSRIDEGKSVNEARV